MAAVDGFHIHIGEVTGLQSFFVFYGPVGTASAVCSAGITIQREVRESSEGPHYSNQTYPTFTWPQSLTIDSMSSLCLQPSAPYIIDIIS